MQTVPLPLSENLFQQVIDYCHKHKISIEEFTNNTIAEKLTEQHRREDNDRHKNINKK